eukprot:Skav216670  [mRNA]  locus=scaffold2477:88603:89118:+ [translate_table: standard]
MKSSCRLHSKKGSARGRPMALMALFGLAMAGRSSAFLPLGFKQIRAADRSRSAAVERWQPWQLDHAGAAGEAGSGRRCMVVMGLAAMVLGSSAAMANDEPSPPKEPAADGSLTRKLDRIRQMSSDPEKFWDGDASGPEPEGNSSAQSRGMMKAMKRWKKKRAAENAPENSE